MTPGALPATGHGLHVEAAGDPAAPAIVFLHGGGISGWMWRPQVERLAGDYRCLVPDLPEHGRSRDVSPFSIDDAVRRIGQLIRDEARGGRAHIVGLSLGGQIGLQLIASDPAIIDHAVLSGTSVRPIWGRSLVGPTIRLSMPLNRFDWFVRANFRQLRVHETHFAEFEAEARSFSADALVRITNASLAFRLPAGLQAARVPCLIADGAKEPKTLQASGREIVGALPSARSVLVPGLGHVWNLESPDLFTNAVKAWLEDRPLPADWAAL